MIKITAIFKNRYLAAVLIILLLVVFGYLYFNQSRNNSVNSKPIQYTFNIVNTYPHNQTAFTQGLVFEEGFQSICIGRQTSDGVDIAGHNFDHVYRLGRFVRNKEIVGKIGRQRSGQIACGMLVVHRQLKARIVAYSAPVGHVGVAAEILVDILGGSVQLGLSKICVRLENLVQHKI